MRSLSIVPLNETALHPPLHPTRPKVEVRPQQRFQLSHICFLLCDILVEPHDMAWITPVGQLEEMTGEGFIIARGEDQAADGTFRQVKSLYRLA